MDAIQAQAQRLTDSGHADVYTKRGACSDVLSLVAEVRRLQAENEEARRGRDAMLSEADRLDIELQRVEAERDEARRERDALREKINRARALLVGPTGAWDAMDVLA